MAVNRGNGKPYVGKTIGTMEKRRQEHEQDAARGSKLCFHKALRKYGSDGFDWFKVCEGDEDKSLLIAEKNSIKFFDSLSPNGYNLTEGGQSGVPSLEVRQRIAISLTGHEVPENVREKIRKKLEGRKCPEHSIRMTGRKQTAESNAKRSRSLNGRAKSVEHRLNLSKSHKNLSLEKRANQRVGLASYIEYIKQNGISDETRRKLRESHIGKKQSEETKAKKNAKLRGRPKSEETKARMRAAWVKRRLRVATRTLPS